MSKTNNKSFKIFIAIVSLTVIIYESYRLISVGRIVPEGAINILLVALLLGATILDNVLMMKVGLGMLFASTVAFSVYYLPGYSYPLAPKSNQKGGDELGDIGGLKLPGGSTLLLLAVGYYLYTKK